MMRGNDRTTIMTTLAVLLLLAACQPAPGDIRFGSDICAHCRMIITEPEFASQTVNMQGRSYPFDSIECMAAHELKQELDPEQVHARWAPDFEGDAGWLRIDEAVFLHSETLRSPMGLYLSAYADRENAGAFKQEYGGLLLDWAGVLELVRHEWMEE